MLDEELMKKIRIKQAQLIKKSAKSVSFSRVLNDILRSTLKLYRQNSKKTKTKSSIF